MFHVKQLLIFYVESPCLCSHYCIKIPPQPWSRRKKAARAAKSPVQLFKAFDLYFGAVPHRQRLLGLANKAISHPKTTAAVIPGAVAVNPPLNTPKSPFDFTAFSTPAAMV